MGPRNLPYGNDLERSTIHLGIVHITMSSLEELKDALRDTLAARGSLGQIQARVRAEIFSALEETVSFLHSCFWFFALFRVCPESPEHTAPAGALGGVAAGINSTP